MKYECKTFKNELIFLSHGDSIGNCSFEGCDIIVPSGVSAFYDFVKELEADWSEKVSFINCYVGLLGDKYFDKRLQRTT